VIIIIEVTEKRADPALRGVSQVESLKYCIKQADEESELRSGL